MKRSVLLATVFAAVLVIVLPFVGGSGPAPAEAQQASHASSIFASSRAAAQQSAILAVSTTAVAPAAVATVEHVAQKPVPPPPPVAAPATKTVTTVVRSNGRLIRVTHQVAVSGSAAAPPAAGRACPANVGGSTGGADGSTVDGVIGTTTSADLASFARQMNAIRVANCLPPIPLANYRFNSCLQARLLWVAEDPSPNVNSAWGHKGTVRSDGVAEPADCDGNLAGGYGNTGAVVAQKWWSSLDHRAALYRPTYTASTAHVCIQFAMVHGGLPNDGYSFTRASAVWVSC